MSAWSAALCKPWNQMNLLYATGGRSEPESQAKWQFPFSTSLISVGHHGIMRHMDVLMEHFSVPATQKEREAGRKRRGRCPHLPLPKRWSRRVWQSSASLWEAGTSGAGKGMAGRLSALQLRHHTEQVGKKKAPNCKNMQCNSTGHRPES